MEKTLGQIIGVVETDEFGCKAASNIDVRVKIKIDFTETSNEDIIKWLVADRKIAFRSPRNKSLKPEQYKECNGKVFAASKINEKPQLTEREKNILQIESLYNQGLIPKETFEAAMQKLNNN